MTVTFDRNQVEEDIVKLVVDKTRGYLREPI